MAKHDDHDTTKKKALPPVSPVETGPRYLTEMELAERLHLSVQFLRKRRDRREPPYYSKFGRRVRYPIAEVERFEADALQVQRPVSRLPADPGAR